MSQDFLKECGCANKELKDRFEFRNILPEEADQAVSIEKICFPPNEACSETMMKERVAVAPDLFLVAVDKNTGKLAGFLNGLSTNELAFPLLIPFDRFDLFGNVLGVHVVHDGPKWGNVIGAGLHAGVDAVQQ